MKKVIAYLFAFMLIIVGVLSLASCSGDSFYKEWTNAGAEIETTHMFKSVTVDEVDALLKNSEKNTFALFFGSSVANGEKNSDAASDVTAMQYTADVKNYKGKVYFLTITEIKKSKDKVLDVKKKLGEQIDFSMASNNVGCVMYKNGKIEFKTINDNAGTTNKFEINGKVSVVAILEYVIEQSTVENWPTVE